MKLNIIQSSRLFERIEARKQADKLHQENIAKTTQHRLEVAKKKGDQNLIQQLEVEMSYRK